MRGRAIFAAAAVLVGVAPGAIGQRVFIGTHTGGGSEARGIYRAVFDAATGQLGVPELAVAHEAPGFLALHPEKPVLYTIGRARGELPDGQTDAVAAFRMDEAGGLDFMGEASAGGRGVCHLAVDATGRTVAVANYGGGSFATIRLDADGVPERLVSLVQVTDPHGPNESRQRAPHAHGVYFDANNAHLFVPDLGTDRVHVRRFDAATSELGEALPALVTAAGAGPRHMAFSPDWRHAYVINELDGTLLAAAYDAETAAFEVMAAPGTLPEDFEGGNTTAEVEVHPNGRFVYASNRGHDSIAVFHRDVATGALAFVQHAPSGGGHPRHFKIDPSGRWLLCANRDSNNIVVFSIDPERGTLEAVGEPVASPSPICILFVE